MLPEYLAPIVSAHVPAPKLLCCSAQMKMRTWAETIGAKYSGNIYYFHIAMATIISKALYAAGMGPVYEQLGSALVFVGSIAVAYMIVRIQDKIGIHILK